jgi:hypothetical protein
VSKSGTPVPFHIQPNPAPSLCSVLSGPEWPRAGKKHYSQTDDLWTRFKVPEWRVFSHRARLRNRPARLKLILSDNTV